MFVLELEGAETHFRLQDIKSVTTRLGRTPRRLAFTDGSIFESDDNDGIDRLLPERVGASGRLASAERFHWRLAGIVAVTLLGIVGLFTYGIPAAARFAAFATPPSVTSMIDDSTLYSLDATLAHESSLPAEDRSALRDAFGGFVSAAGLDPSDYTLQFRNIPAVGPNAFALPGGTLVVTDDLVRLMGDEGLVIAVLAHEIGHVEHRHGLRLVYRAFGLSMLVGFITGDFGDLAGTIADQASVLSVLANSRGFETEADASAARLLSAAGYDTADLARALEKLVEHCSGCGEGSFFTSHPGVPERTLAIRGLSKNLDRPKTSD
ncbi:MAG: M48 family metallopeptidase [Rhizobiaceae bacterium]|nr:M48 family metallopeptidase [Rhizobiaceae bacterium]